VLLLKERFTNTTETKFERYYKIQFTTAQNNIIKLKRFFVVQVLNSKLGNVLRVSVTSATILMANRTRHKNI